MTTLRRLVPRLALAAMAFCLHVTRVAASTISIGAEIPITANTFALPIAISAGIDIVGWQFDLTYDPPTCRSIPRAIRWAAICIARC